MKIKLTVDGRVLNATLADTGAARAFVAMLPVTLAMHDLFGREKFGALPHAIGPAEVRSRTCEPGDIVCWAPGPDLAVLYGEAGIPLTGGFHLLGRIDGGVDAFAARGPLEVTIELACTQLAPSRTPARQ